jgi:hypothetical protein
VHPAEFCVKKEIYRKVTIHFKGVWFDFFTCNLCKRWMNAGISFYIWITADR